MSVEMNLFKQLEKYWRTLARTVNSGDLSGLKHQGNLLEYSGSSTPLSSVSSMPDVYYEQTVSVLDMFKSSSIMTTPYFVCAFNPKAATTYWKLMTRPIHVDLVEDFDDPEWKIETRFFRNKQRQLTASSPGSEHDSLSSHAQSPVYIDASKLSSPTNPGSPSEDDKLCPSTTTNYEMQWTFPERTDGLFESPTGRQFDAISDFLHIRSPRVEDILSLLEYGMAFLRGTTFLSWSEVTSHITFNCERIINLLIFKRRSDLTYKLAERLINVITIFAFQYEHSGKTAAISSFLLLAHQLAQDHGIHVKDPVLVSRVYMSLLWWARTPMEREEYMEMASRIFADLPGIEWRCKFSYVASALRSQKKDDPCITHATPLEFWIKCESYLKDAEVVVPMLPNLGLPHSSAVFFQSLFCVLRAELGPRINEDSWPIQQALVITNLISSLEDVDTLIFVTLLKRSCLNTRGTSASFFHNGRSMSVSDYLIEQLDDIPIMPINVVAPLNVPLMSDILPMMEEDQASRTSATNTVLEVATPGTPNSQMESDEPTSAGESCYYINVDSASPYVKMPEVPLATEELHAFSILSGLENAKPKTSPPLYKKE